MNPMRVVNIGKHLGLSLLTRFHSPFSMEPNVSLQEYAKENSKSTDLTVGLAGVWQLPAMWYPLSGSGIHCNYRVTWMKACMYTWKPWGSFVLFSNEGRFQSKQWHLWVPDVYTYIYRDRFVFLLVCFFKFFVWYTRMHCCISCTDTAY